MKPYSEYSAEELAMERLFIRWVRDPNDPEIGKFWDGWVTQYPHMLTTVAVAQALVRSASDVSTESISVEEANSLWSRIRSTIETFPEIRGLDSNVRNFAGKLFFLRWSIGILSTIAIILILFFARNGNSNPFDHFRVMGSDSSTHRVERDSVSTGKHLLPH
jgi:hypothetical protein